MTTKRTPIGYFRVLEYNGDYKSFEDFYDQHKSEIYESIVAVFEEFKTTSKKVLTINLSSTIGGMFWNSDFGFTKDQFFVLKRDVLPYFEEEENYEMCNRIMKIHNHMITC